MFEKIMDKLFELLIVPDVIADIIVWLVIGLVVGGISVVLTITAFEYNTVLGWVVGIICLSFVRVITRG